VYERTGQRSRGAEFRGVNGRLVECGDVEGVAEAIGWFLGLDAGRLGRLSRHAREKAEHVFSVDKHTQGLLRFYREVFGRGGQTL